MHLGGLLSTQEARVALGILSCLATFRLHLLLNSARRDVYHLLKITLLSVFNSHSNSACNKNDIFNNTNFQVRRYPYSSTRYARWTNPPSGKDSMALEDNFLRQCPKS